MTGLLQTPLVRLLGGQTAEALAASLGLHTAGELLRHYPRRYAERGELTNIAGLRVGEHVTVLARIEKAHQSSMRSRSGTLLKVVLGDGQHTLECTFFNPRKLRYTLVPGRHGLFAGKVTRFRTTLQLAQPDFELITGGGLAATESGKVVEAVPGARLVITMINELKRRGGGLGAAALCGGGGQGDAALIQTL